MNKQHWIWKGYVQICAVIMFLHKYEYELRETIFGAVLSAAMVTRRIPQNSTLTYVYTSISKF